MLANKGSKKNVKILKIPLEIFVGLPCNNNMKEISYYYTADNKCPYLDWFNELDVSMQVRVNKRVKKLSEGV